MAADDPATTSPTPSTNGHAPGDDLYRRVRQLEEELAATHQALGKMTLERDAFKRLLLEETAKSVRPFTEDELAGAVPARPWLENIIRDLERS